MALEDGGYKAKLVNKTMDETVDGSNRSYNRARKFL